MVRYIFPENEEIARQNRRRHGSNYKVLDFTPKENKNKPQNVETKKRPKYTHCKKCGKLLEGFRSKMWGICAICDD